MAELLILDLSNIKKDLLHVHKECSARGLLQSAKWAAELAYAFDQINSADVLPSTEESKEFISEYDRYTLAKSYFDVKEYDRAAHFVQYCSSAKANFLYLYCLYLAGEKKKLDDASDSLGGQDNVNNQHLKTLRNELHRKYKDNQLDGYGLYLYAITLKKLDLLQDAVDMFVQAVNKEPLHWGAWQELALLVTDKDMLNCLAVPEHWMKHLFVAHVYLEIQLNEEALKVYEQLNEYGFSRSSYVMAQVAQAYHNLKDVDLAVEAFNKLQKVDPYRLENMDTYSNLLYVKEMRPELAHLAHHCCDIDKYRVETCCVIGNYYSLRSQHEKAVLYFQRALKLNPTYLSALTLMGHEYMELKNTSAAIQAYRQAIESNRKDYRAWYGLGQTYEILKMPLYSLYYYRQAQVLRPNDSRMVVALGEAYEKLERLQEAKKCYWKAHSLGDVEGLALIRLAKLYEKLDEWDQAAAAFREYINEIEAQGTYCYEELCQAYKYLANYHLRNGRLDEAYAAAQKCTEFNETREEGKALLRQISKIRSLGAESGMQIDTVSATADRHQSHTPEQSTPENRLLPMNLLFTPENP